MKRFVISVLSMMAVMMVASVAFAAGGEMSEFAMQNGGWIAVAAAFGIGLGVFGGAISQGKTAAAALEGIARNPNAADKVFVPMILGLAFIESLVLFNWVLMFLLQGKIV
ncbi:MAG: hypothetical protein A2289_24440 [Deltaproteobacteria bacterium RIFOXYA12_FULL_58_15]|nr:MAG: hypothetical protein A2289_24440 [Deltaproteobacteria bacterium RIFOXYA12_FULL_58_15]OGR09000.1 MAG: hypothetical protein A2341_11690 [Deltaproteobacteria bacterium RIFOXYB12_FULL_58_9]